MLLWTWPDTENLTHLPKGWLLPDWEEFTTQRQASGSFPSPSTPQTTHSQVVTWRQVSIRNNGHSCSPVVKVLPQAHSRQPALQLAVLTQPPFQVFPYHPVNSNPTPPGAADLNGCMLGPFFLWKHIFIPSSLEVNSYLICYFVQHGLGGVLGTWNSSPLDMEPLSRDSFHEEPAFLERSAYCFKAPSFHLLRIPSFLSSTEIRWFIHCAFLSTSFIALKIKFYSSSVLQILSIYFRSTYRSPLKCLF